MCRDTDQLLRRTNPKLQSGLPAARNLTVVGAGDFDVACDDFTDMLQAGDEWEVVRELYFFVHDEWQRLNLSLYGILSQQAGQSMRDIERSLTEL